MSAQAATQLPKATAASLTEAMRRELRSIGRDGNPSDPYDWQHAPEALWFHARDKVLTALLRRELIWDNPARSGYDLTEAGRALLKEIGEDE